ncbi:MAG: hypothetical protein HY716_04715 [Planctomycetes bacterium]|nr:hypothetical protein [Planctomycetota bacterium]
MNLHVGNYYYVSVRATSESGFTSAVAVRDGVVPVFSGTEGGGGGGGNDCGGPDHYAVSAGSGGGCGSVGLDWLLLMALSGLARRLTLLF